MFKFLVVLVIILGVVALVQLAKVANLSAEARNKRAEDISDADNKFNANLMMIFMVLFYASFIVLMVKYGDYLPTPASEHGAALDTLLNVNFAVIIVVFFIVNTLLFYFSWKFYYRKDRKARWFPHDNRLEMAWTIAPAVFLAVIIVYGLLTWNEITDEPSEGALQVELYSKQFDWTARYPGVDGAFGASSFNLISSSNPLGIVSKSGVAEKVAELDEEISFIEADLKKNSIYWPESKIEAKRDKINRLVNHKKRVLDLESYKVATTSDSADAWSTGSDDQLVIGEFHLPLGREVEMLFRSRDVIHSAYLPHFRAQMNCVPGTPTSFKMKPTYTTEQMREELGDPEFDYVLLCNKVCGAAHFNMKIKVVVESEEKYNAWIAEQKAFNAPDEPATEPTANQENKPSEENDLTALVQD